MAIGADVEGAVVGAGLASGAAPKAAKGFVSRTGGALALVGAAAALRIIPGMGGAGAI